MAREKIPAAHTDNDFKASYAVKTCLAYLSLAFLAGRVSVNFQLALGIFITYFFWNLVWIKILVESPNIYSVRVPTTLLDDWIQFSIPSSDGPKIRKDKVVTSISELSGIRGAHMMVAMRVMTSVINALALVAIQVDLHYRNAIFLNIKSGADMVPVCMLLHCLGAFLCGHFELNMMDLFHANGHYLGVLMIFMGSFGMGFVTHWSLLSILMIGIEFGLCFAWILCCMKVEKKSNDISVVTRNSKLCVGIELLVFQTTNLMLIYTVYSAGPNEGNFWVSPFIQ